MRGSSTSDNFSHYAYTFDGQGNVASVDNAGTPGVPDVVLRSQYDTGGNRSSLSASIGGTKDFLNSYSYDTLSRLNQVIQQQQTGGNAVAAKEIDYGYNAIGQVTARSAYNFIGVGPRYDIATSAISYNPLGLLTGIAMTSHAGQVALDNLTYSYDTLARVHTFGSVDGTATYGYDPTSQLISATYAAASGHVEPPNFSIGFDPNGNRSTVNGASTTISSNNEVTNDGTFTYQFDQAGNRTMRTRISTAYAADYRTTYAWDYRNRLTDVEMYDNNGVLSQHVHYVYDVWDHLIERELDPNGSGSYTVDTHYVWDASAPPTLGEAGQPPSAPGSIVLAFNGSQQLATRYLVGPNTSAYDPYLTTLAEEDVTSTGQTGAVTFDLPDKQGSLVDVADDSGALANHVTYTAFGLDFGETNPSVPHIAGYGGGYYDAATGLINNVERWYDPLATVWISADPMGFRAGDANTSRYVSNSATNFTDPSGLDGPAQISSDSRALAAEQPEMQMSVPEFGKAQGWKPGTIKYIDGTGCWALLQVRLGLFDDRLEPTPGDLMMQHLFGTTPPPGNPGSAFALPYKVPGVKLFASSTDAEAYMQYLESQGKQPVMFIIQRDIPAFPAPPGFSPKFYKSQLHPLQLAHTSAGTTNQASLVNYVAVQYYGCDKRRYFEYVDDAGGPVVHTPTLPSRVYKFNYFAVIVPPAPTPLYMSPQRRAPLNMSSPVAPAAAQEEAEQ